MRNRPGLARWSIIIASAAGGFILVLLTFFVGKGFEETAALRREVIRSYELRATLQRVMSLHQDLELGQRGYVITSKRTFLQPYYSASRGIDDAFAGLDDHVRQDSSIHAELVALHRASNAKRQFVQRTIELTQRGAVERARQLVALGEGKRLMDAIRQGIARIDQVERRELQRRTDAAERARLRLEGRTKAMLILLLLIVGTAAWLVMRSNKARLLALDAAQDLAARQEAIFDYALDGMIVLNPSGSIESLNPAAARMFGYSIDSLVRRDIGTLFEVAPDRGRIETFLRRLTAERKGRMQDVQEFVGRRANGASFPLEVTVSPVHLAGATLFLAVTRDISERREVEQMKAEFVATVSHELRTPLTSIAGSLGLVTGGAAGELPPKARRLVEIAESNSARLVRLINDILDIEKIQAGSLAFDIRPIALDTILSTAVQDNAGFASRYDVHLELKSIPPGASVLADHDRMMQVLTNLLSNAIKFSPASATVTVQVTHLDRRYRISIIDRGSGIPAAFKERIFGKFAQADGSDTRQKGGTGLGLSIAKEIVTRLGGSIGFESEEGRGTAFHVDLPEATVPETGGLSPAAAVESNVHDSLGGLPRILHVDDDPDVLRVLASAFDGRALIRSTPSVVEAREMIRQHQFDAAILDVGMLDGCGLDLVPQLRQSRGNIPIVVFTAQDVEPAALSGVDATLIKSRASLDLLVTEVMDRTGKTHNEQRA